MPINQLNQRMSAMNPMMLSPMGQMPMGFPGQPAPGWGMPGMMNMTPNMLSPAQFMVPPPPNADPAFLAAHQQAMMVAKQAYQMAVAQQAMAAAGDEWERSSNMGGFGGGSVYGGGGSVYGGSQMGSSMGTPIMMNAQFGMMQQMQQMQAMGMMGGNNWSTGSAIFPASRSMYDLNLSSSRSDYGGGMNQGGGLAPNWSSSRSSYGDPGANGGRGGGGDGRQSGYGMNPPMPPIPTSGSAGKPGQPRMRTTSQPAHPTRTTGVGPRKAPPSSWKASGI